MAMIASGDPERTPNPVCPAKVAEMVKAGDALHNPVAKETFVILKTATDTGGQLFQMDVTVAAGQGTKTSPHIHPVHEMRLVIKAGQMKLWLTDQEKNPYRLVAYIARLMGHPWLHRKTRGWGSPLYTPAAPIARATLMAGANPLSVMRRLNMKDNTLAKLGGICSILLGISYIVIAVIYLLVPPEQQEGSGIPLGKFLESFAQNPAPLTVGYLVFALGSLLGIAAVLAISESVRSVNEGWVCWISNLAVIGFAVNAVDWFRSLALDPARAAAYVQGDAAVKAALTVPGAIAHLDPQAWVRLGAVGLWILVVSLLALRGSNWPRPLAYLGIAAAIGHWLIVASNVVQVPSQLLRTIIVGVSVVILPPIWYIWLGLRLRKTG